MLSHLQENRWWVAAAVMLLFAASQVWLAYLRNDQSLRMQQLASEQQSLQQELQKLNLELASLANPERLRQLANDELGMAPPKPQQVVRP